MTHKLNITMTAYMLSSFSLQHEDKSFYMQTKEEMQLFKNDVPFFIVNYTMWHTSFSHGNMYTPLNNMLSFVCSTFLFAQPLFARTRLYMPHHHVMLADDVLVMVPSLSSMSTTLAMIKSAIGDREELLHI